MDLFVLLTFPIFFLVCFSLVGSYALDEELQEKLWTFSEQLMREKVKEP